EPRHWIEGAERLVEEQDLGIEHQRPHQADPLRLPTGELAGKTAQRVMRKADDCRELFDPRGDARRIPPKPARGQRDVLIRPEVREQRATLDYVSDLAPDALQPVGWQGAAPEAPGAAIG